MAATRSQSADLRRSRIVTAAAELLTEGGRNAVSTRAVSAAAGVQAPTIYRLFGDMQGLLDAVASDAFATYLQSKNDLEAGDDPVDDLRAGWDQHVGFGLANPDLYSLMYGAPRPGPMPPAAIAAAAILTELIHRIAAVGRLRVDERRAAELLHAAGSGTTLTLIATPEHERDPALSEMAREAIITAITTDAPSTREPGAVAAAVALRAALPESSVLSRPEQRLLEEWLDRLAESAR